MKPETAIMPPDAFSFLTRAAGLVRPPQTRPALARHARPVPHLGLGNHAPADPGGDGDSLLSALAGSLSQSDGAGRGAAAGCAGRLGRPGLLLARSQPASRGAAGGG